MVSSGYEWLGVDTISYALKTSSFELVTSGYEW